MIKLICLFLFLGAPLWPLTLQQAEEIALCNNPQILAAEELIERARQGKLEAISKWLPQISLLSQGFRTQKPLTFFQIDRSAFYTQVSLTQAIVSSEYFYDVRIAELLINQFDELLRAARNDILLQTRILYNLVALDRRKLATAEEHINLLTLLRDQMEGKFNIGEATAYNVNQAKVALANVKNDYYDAIKNLKSHEDELAQALGIDPVENCYQFDQREIQLVDVPHWSVCEWIAIADARRPDIMLSQTALNIAQQQVKKRKGEYLPTVSLLGGYGGSQTPYLELPSSRFTNQNFNWGVGISLNWDIFDGWGRERRIRKAKHEQAAVGFDATKTMQMAHTEVLTQLYRIEDAKQKLQTARETLELAEETLQQAISQLEIGYITLFDYMISVDGLVFAKTALDQSRFELTSAYYSLLHACGKDEL